VLGSHITTIRSLFLFFVKHVTGEVSFKAIPRGGSLSLTKLILVYDLVSCR